MEACTTANIPHAIVFGTWPVYVQPSQFSQCCTGYVNGSPRRCSLSLTSMRVVAITTLCAPAAHARRSLHSISHCRSATRKPGRLVCRACPTITSKVMCKRGVSLRHLLTQCCARSAGVQFHFRLVATVVPVRVLPRPPSSVCPLTTVAETRMTAVASRGLAGDVCCPRRCLSDACTCSIASHL